MWQSRTTRLSALPSLRDHTKTKAKSPQTNSICAAVELNAFTRRFSWAAGADEFYAIAFRKKLYTSLEQLQQDVDLWLDYYNQQPTHLGKYCFGKTPMQTFLESVPLAKEKLLEQLVNPALLPFCTKGSRADVRRSNDF